MENTTYIALSRQIGLRREMDIVAQNIANANTPAFKGERLIFREFLSTSESSDELSFVQDVGTARDTTNGPLVSTGNALDVAITREEGFFVVDTPLGERYTRHGRFQLDEEGTLVTSTGYPVMGAGGPITIDGEEGPIAIAIDGTISNDEGVVDQLRVVDFEDTQQLRKAANGLYTAPPDVEPEEMDDPQLAQGMIEESNVQPILELTRMMDIHRTHDSVARFLKQEDDRIKDMLDRIGRPAQA
ncbi:MAG: flagellar basal-body rod protein FlgF [Alphaproteobacteria bacterium]